MVSSRFPYVLLGTRHSALVTPMSTAERRQARITALQTLYEVDTTEHTAEEVMLRLFNEPMSESQPEGDPLVEGTVEHQGDLDEIIARSAPNWPVAQMSSIDKNILRLAIFEILFDNRVPLKAAINEAVELGKRFGSDSSSRFING
ncbi:MAG TPA: transcription antitermination factor NusB, partial [Chloroflexia bacterium]|nr:transcription antitermination factor NusB [Chloroflexia bacterium]